MDNIYEFKYVTWGLTKDQSNLFALSFIQKTENRWHDNAPELNMSSMTITESQETQSQLSLIHKWEQIYTVTKGKSHCQWQAGCQMSSDKYAGA